MNIIFWTIVLYSRKTSILSFLQLILLFFFIFNIELNKYVNSIIKSDFVERGHSERWAGSEHGHQSLYREFLQIIFHDRLEQQCQ